MLLLGAAIAVFVAVALVSYASYRLGFDGVGVLVVIETVLVFGAALSYCATYWPKWSEQRRVRTRILLTLFVVFAAHSAIVALTIRRLRPEWGAPVWMGIGLVEIVCITLALQVAVRPLTGLSHDAVDRTL